MLVIEGSIPQHPVASCILGLEKGGRHKEIIPLAKEFLECEFDAIISSSAFIYKTVRNKDYIVRPFIQQGVGTGDVAFHGDIVKLLVISLRFDAQIPANAPIIAQYEVAIARESQVAVSSGKSAVRISGLDIIG